MLLAWRIKLGPSLGIARVRRRFFIRGRSPIRWTVLVLSHIWISDIAWSDIESMLKHLGAEISEGRGSRIRVALNGERAVFHRPHPQKETDRGAVVSVQRFLLEAGIERPKGDEE